MIDRNNASVTYKLGDVLESQGQTEAAEAMFLILLQGEDVSLYMRSLAQGRVSLLRWAVDQAIVALEAARHSGPTRAEAAYYLGHAYFRHGDIDQARQSWLDTTAVDPGNSTGLHLWALLSIADHVDAPAGDCDQAAEMYRRAIRLATANDQWLKDRFLGRCGLKLE